MGQGTSAGILAPLFIAVVLSVILAGLGLYLRRRGTLKGQRAALVWAIVTVLPVGVVMVMAVLAG